MESQSTLNLHFSNDQRCWTLKYIFLNHFYLTFCGLYMLPYYTFRLACLIFMMLSFLKCLQILISAWYIAGKVFSPFSGLPIYFNDGVLCLIENFSYTWSHLSIVGLNTRVTGALFRKSFLVYFHAFSIGFRAKYLMTWSLIYLKLSFVQYEW